MSFTSQLAARIEVAKADIDRVPRIAVNLAAQGMSEKAPVKSGRLRGSLVFGANSPTASDPNQFDKSGATTLSRIAEQVAGQKAGSVLYVTTNLPYARVVEYGLYPSPPKSKSGKTEGGFSKQAPAGFVRLTFAELPEAVRQYVAGGLK